MDQHASAGFKSRLWWPVWLRQRAPLAWAVVGALLVLTGLLLGLWWRGPAAAPVDVTQDDIDAAVRHTLETQPLPSRTARAAEQVRQSVVRVRGYVSQDGQDAPDGKSGQSGKKKDSPPSDKQHAGKPKPKTPAKPERSEPPELPDELADEGARAGERLVGIGSGVVILDNGTILTNLHVVAGAERLSVTFHDGLESDAVVVGLHPKNDLAVIRAQKIPDDLPPATMGVAARLRPGDEVVAVGFPFGIGPSVSSGVVSGLNRSWRSSKGKNLLGGLIQFDAAANPGNSGGPLINMEGELVGIVTAILNPTEARTFIGIGFAVTMESAGTAVGIPPF
jgi:S1-C subfamily serine protease